LWHGHQQIFGDKHDLNVHYKTCSSQSYSYCAFIAYGTTIIIMQDDDQNGCVNEDLIGGIEDVDNSMMETMFNLSAYVSGTNNDDNNDDESDDDVAFSQQGGRNNRQDAASQGWTYLTGSNQPEVFISIDGVDNRLLDRAREEVPTVLLKLKKKIGVRRDRDVRTLSPGDCLKAFMDPMFLGYMKAFINTNMSNSNDLVSSSDIIAFIRVELMISFYKVRARDDVNMSTPLHTFIDGLTSNFRFWCCSPSCTRFLPLCTLILQMHRTSPPPPLA
jgi:hypothetical protein